MNNNAIKITCWNVNSVKARMPLIQLFLKEEDPDILVLQETKSTDATFPKHDFEPQFNAYIHGQPSYNGVAIIAKNHLQVQGVEVLKIDPEQARCIRVNFHNFAVMSVYVPCGDGPIAAQERKTNFMLNLIHYLQTVKDQPIIVTGDFNVAMKDQDVEFPEKFYNSPLCLPNFRKLFADLLQECALIDTFQPNPDFKKNPFTWWHHFGYKSKGSYIHSGGVRIDYILHTANIKDRIVDNSLLFHKKYRDITLTSIVKNKPVETKPSDHIPLSISIKM